LEFVAVCPAPGHDRFAEHHQAGIRQLNTDLEERGYMRREDDPLGGRRRLIVMTDKALPTRRPRARSCTSWNRRSPRAGGDTLLALRTELARLIRASTGDSDIPPLRPLW
jgi:hypothetical protein